jgi:hypothetical protein
VKGKPKEGYCECCDLKYSKGIEEHRKSARHNDFSLKVLLLDFILLFKASVDIELRGNRPPY